MSEERKAVYYGKVELIPGVICDGYILDDGTAVMSERGTADLLGMHHKSLQSVAVNWPPKALKPFIDNDFSVAVKSVEVTAENSPHKGREIIVYTSETIENLIFSYAMAFAHDTLREKQRHIGKRCVILMRLLVRAALDAAIRESCGLQTNIQQTAQQHYLDAVELVIKAGLICSIEKDKIATKKDICLFLGIPLGTLNSFLRKHRDDIIPILLDRQITRTLGFKSAKMNGYSIENVARIALSMNTVPGIELKQQLFGPIGIFAKPDTSQEVQWQAKLGVAFDGFGFCRNYPVGPYRVDFLIGDSKVVLECNGYEHHYYDPEKERVREEFITRDYGLVRFGHHVDLEKLINAILRIKPGEVIRLFDSQECQALV